MRYGYMGFERECMRYGYMGIDDFEKSVIEPLLLYKKITFSVGTVSVGTAYAIIFNNYPKWLLKTLKDYYDINAYISSDGSFYTLSIDYVKEKFVDENTLNNYFG